MTEPSVAAACAACAEDLSAWIDGELDERRARDVSAHVAACARCRERIEALLRVDGALRALADAPLTRSDAARLERIRARVPTSRRAASHAGTPNGRPGLAVARPPAPRPPRRRGRLLTAGLAAIAAVALGALVVPGLLERATGRVPGSGAVLAPRGERDAGEEILADRQRAEPSPRAPSAAAPGPKPLTPGHLGASAAADPPGAPSEDGAATPSDFDAADMPLVERLDALEALPRIDDLRPDERRALAERLDPLRAETSADRERLRDNVARWRATPPSQREALRQRWSSLQALPADERDRVLRGESSMP